MNIQVIASGSNGNATIINDGVTSLLLDAGVSIKRLYQLTRHRVTDVAGCLITHEHLDHAKAVKDLTIKGVDVYSSQGTFNSLKISGHRCKDIESLRTVNIGTFSVMPFDVVHDAVEPLGFLAESNVTEDRLIYFSDTAYVKYRFKGYSHYRRVQSR